MNVHQATPHSDRHIPAHANSNPSTTATVLVGTLPAADRAALEWSLDDLQCYWERAFGARTLDRSPPVAETPVVRILVGRAHNLPEIATLERAGGLPQVTLGPEGFAVDVMKTDAGHTAVLRADDRLGLQYAVYCFAEHYLGVRFVHPLLELRPDSAPCPAELQLRVRPERRMRIFYETSHLHNGLRGTMQGQSHFSDVGAWRWEDFAGNHERTKLLVAWAIKNYANIVIWDATFIQIPGEQCPPTKAVWEYLEARGLKTILMVHPSNLTRRVPYPHIPVEDHCGETTEIARMYMPQLCPKRPSYWKMLAENLTFAKKHSSHLAAAVSLWDEGPSAVGALGSPPTLAKSGCPRCGDITNAEKWSQELDYLNSPDVRQEYGLGPIGLGHMGWHTAAPNDDLAAEIVVPHLPAGSLSILYYYTNNVRVRSMEGWLRRLDEANAADGPSGGGRQVLALRELLFGCQTDFPLVHPSSLETIDRDFKDFSKFKCVATYAAGVYIMHSMGWLLVWYELHKQFDQRISWRSWLDETFSPLIGKDSASDLVTILSLLKDVQLYDGLRGDGESYRHYCWYALDPHTLTPETLGGTEGKSDWLRLGNFAPSGEGKFVRLVSAGLQDTSNIYHAASLQPAIARVSALLAKSQRVEALLEKLSSSLSRTREAAFWMEHLVQPVRWTLGFLKSHLKLFLSYGRFVEALEQVQAGQDAAAALLEGQTLCREALHDQHVYMCLRPGFAGDYPQEINPDTLRCLIAAWQDLARRPEQILQLDLCSFLDQAENQSAGTPAREPTGTAI